MKKFFSKYWIAVLSVLMFAVGAYIAFSLYRPASEAYKTASTMLDGQIAMLQNEIAEETVYADVQDLLESEKAALDESREELYSHFTSEMREEDQILYIIYLEDVFKDGEILPYVTETGGTFSFGSPSGIAPLGDGSTLGALTLTVGYKTTYQGFKDVINRFATDTEYITSIEGCTLQYDPDTDTAQGTMTLRLYLLDHGQEYEQPDVSGGTEPGKKNIFN